MPLDSSRKPDVAETLGLHESNSLKRRVKRYALPILAVVAAVAGGLNFRTADHPAGPQYKTEQIRRGNLSVVVTATGSLQPTNTVSVGSELSGIIKSVEADYNDRVKAGQVLARLDTSRIEAQLTESRAALESAKAKVLQARATVAEAGAKLAQYKKVRELSNGKVPSQAEMDAAEAALERAKADDAGATALVAQARAALQTIEADFNKSVIRSPINGIVLTRNIEAGQTVAASFQAPVLFTLAEDLTRMELRVNVDEADVGKVREGQKAVFTVAAYPARTFEGVITKTRFASTATGGVVTYETVLRVNNPDLALRQGMTAAADIKVKEIENALLVPCAALRFAPPVNNPASGPGSPLLMRPPMPSQRDASPAVRVQHRVWTVKSGQLTPVQITTGATNGNMSEVTSGGLAEGADVAVDIVAGMP